MPAGQQWGRVYTYTPGKEYLAYGEKPYINNFVSFGYVDEEDPTDPVKLSDMAAKFRLWNNLYPNALAYANFQLDFMAPMPVSGWANYMRVAKPDLMTYDYYPGYEFGDWARNNWYGMLQTYRTLGLAGNDGTGASPIPYGQYSQLFRNTYDDPVLPSESFVRMQQFTNWAFGSLFMGEWLYNGMDGTGSKSVMFSGPGDSSPTPVFNYVAETNRQSRNLGPALVRLVSTDVRMIPGTTGTHQETYYNSWDVLHAFPKHRTVDDNLAMPDGISEWARGAGGDNYITGITPLGNDNGASHIHGDVLIGYFRPLLENNSACTFADGLHFMIVNTIASGTAADSAQWYHLTFDFTGSDFDSLVRLSRDTGKVELVTLTGTGGSQYYLDLNLPGGTGDLFAFWDSSSPLPSVPEPGALMLLGMGIIGTFVYARKRR